ncbi:MAG: hypothetical protein FWD49_00275 [Firmicutes bacterium]|nr:hypothetical protein [Bacillota bacterium]
MSIKEVPIPLDLISTELIQLLIEERGLSQEKAIETLYNSKLYFLIEDAETGVWHYSTTMLFAILCEEIDTGHLTLPEEQ